MPLRGIAMAWYFHAKNRHADGQIRAVTFSPVVTDSSATSGTSTRFTRPCCSRPFWILAHLLGYFDRYIIDGLVLAGRLSCRSSVGYSLKPTQRGLLPRLCRQHDRRPGRDRAGRLVFDS